MSKNRSIQSETDMLKEQKIVLNFKKHQNYYRKFSELVLQRSFLVSKKEKRDQREPSPFETHVKRRAISHIIHKKRGILL